MYFTFFIEWKTGNQLKIHLLPLLADENEYIDDSFVMVLSQRRLKIQFENFYRSAKIN